MGPARRLAPVQPPFLRPGEVNREHVIRIEMAPGRLAAAQREEHPPMLLQNKTVDELDLTPLHDLETARPAQIDQLTACDNRPEGQIPDRVGGVLAGTVEP